MPLSRDPKLDGILEGSQWGSLNLTYTMPNHPDFYVFGAYGQFTSGYVNTQGFQAVNNVQIQAIRDSFAQIQSFTQANFTLVDPNFQRGDLRFAEATFFHDTDGEIWDVSTAFGMFPKSLNGGDVWFNPRDYNNPKPGTFAHATFMHEIGHALGLKHPHNKSGRDTVKGAGGNDILIGRAGNEQLFGDDGDDTLDGGVGGDLLNGGAGRDLAGHILAKAGVLVSLQNPSQNRGDAQGDTYKSIEDVIGTRFADTLIGDAQANFLGGDAGEDRLTGNAGRDTLNGEVGDDLLIGSGDADRLTGGVGGDRFVYLGAGDSRPAARDTITDFSNGDRIALEAIDAVTGPGNQRFSFIGTSGFSPNSEGELRFVRQGGDAILLADVNGDGKADFSVLLLDITSLVGRDFTL